MFIYNRSFRWFQEGYMNKIGHLDSACTLQVLSKEPQGLSASEQKLRAALEPRLCVLHFIGEKTDWVSPSRPHTGWKAGLGLAPGSQPLLDLEPCCMLPPCFLGSRLFGASWLSWYLSVQGRRCPRCYIFHCTQDSMAQHLRCKLTLQDSLNGLPGGP